MKKGFVLIEALIAMCIFTMIVSQVSSILVTEYVEYKNFCELHKERMSINDTLSFIENIIVHSKTYEVFNNNTIVIHEKENVIKEITLKNKKVQVLSKNTNFSSSYTANTISSDNIAYFQVESYGDYMLCVTIKSDKGEKYIRCI